MRQTGRTSSEGSQEAVDLDEKQTREASNIPIRSDRTCSSDAQRNGILQRPTPQEFLMPSSQATSSSVIDSLLERIVEPLFQGDRSGSRAIIAEAFEEGMSAEQILTQLVWPTMDKIQGLYRADRINTGTHHMASRLLRMLSDQLSLRLTRSERNGRTMLVVCSPGEPEELGAQITTDIAEAHGWSVHFAGGGVPNDEIVGWIGQLQPQVLMVYGTIPSATPLVRQLVDLLHDVGISPKLQIICSGGVFNRAEGLAEEIGSDLFAPNPLEALDILAAYPNKRATPEQQTVGRKRRIKKTPEAKAE